jgi:putative flippase GtrA
MFPPLRQLGLSLRNRVPRYRAAFRNGFPKYGTVLGSSRQATLLRYASVSFAATAVDFMCFFLLGNLSLITNGSAAFISSGFGAVVSWNLNRSWVFRDSAVERHKKRHRFFTGVLLGILLNAILVSLLSDLLAMPRMSARVFAALSVWIVIYLYNKRVVFRM